MKITRNPGKPVVPPDTFTCEFTLDEMIFLKTVCQYFASSACEGPVVLAVARRFAESIKENSYTWKNTSNLFIHTIT
jgi:hypothetical protein